MPEDYQWCFSSLFPSSLVFATIDKAQPPHLSSFFGAVLLTTRQNSLYVTVCMIAISKKRYVIHPLSTLHYCNAPDLATRLTSNYRDRTCTGWCDPASLDTPYTIKRLLCRVYALHDSLFLYALILLMVPISLTIPNFYGFLFPAIPIKAPAAIPAIAGPIQPSPIS